MSDIDQISELLTSRPLQTHEDCVAVARLLARMYEEVGRGILNPEKAWAEIQDTIYRHAAFGVFHKELLIASVGIIPLDGGLFYSDVPWFMDKWFYVLPEYRPKSLDAGALKLLLHEVRELCQACGRPAFIRVFNDRRVRARDGVARIAQEFCFYPAGAVMEISPLPDGEKAP